MFNLVDQQLSCVLTIAAEKSVAKMVDRGNSRRQVPQAVGLLGDKSAKPALLDINRTRYNVA
jgi:hypothetical protein